MSVKKSYNFWKKSYDWDKRLYYYQLMNIYRRHAMSKITSEIFPHEIHPKYIQEIHHALPNWSGTPDDLSMCSTVVKAGDAFDRTELAIVQKGDKFNPVVIHVTSLRELFRGDNAPGIFHEYKEEYVPFFWHIETMFYERMCLGDTTVYRDTELVDVYSAMRRRPDGRSIGLLHDMIWQRCAFFMLCIRCSQQEYESCMHRLEHSAKTFRLSIASHNYFDYIIRQCQQAQDMEH